MPPLNRLETALRQSLILHGGLDIFVKRPLVLEALLIASGVQQARAIAQLHWWSQNMNNRFDPMPGVHECL